MRFLLTTFVLHLVLLSNLLAEWEKCNLPYEDGRISSLSNYGERIAFTMEESALYISSELYLSEDNGDNWVKIPFKFENSRMWCVAINQNTIFLVADSSLYVSNDLGGTWVLHLDGIVYYSWGSKPLYCYNDSVFVSIKGGLAKSFDNGESWTWQELPFSPTYFCRSDELMVVTSGSKILYTRDDGNNWVDAEYPPSKTQISSLNILGDKVFVGSQIGLLSSDVNFQTWYDYEDKLPRSTISDIKVFGERIYIAYENFNGVYYSDDLGENWSLISGRLGDILKDIAVNEERIFIGMSKIGLCIYEIEKDSWLRYGKSKSFLSSCGTIGDYIFCTTGIGFMFSKNNGMDWSFNNFAATLNDILVIDSTIYTTFTPFWHSSIDYQSPLSKFGVLKSTDLGASWEALNEGVDFDLPGPIAYSNGTLFTGSVSGIYSSKNFDINWEKVKSFGFWNYIESIVIIDNTILVGFYSNISVSHDFGETWNFVYEDFEGMTYFLSIIGNKTFIRYAAIRWGYNSRDVVGISYDNGKTFDLDYKRDNVPYIYNGNPNIKFEYVDDKTIISDDGDNWYDVEAGLASPARFIIAKDDYLIVQTMDGDLYRIEIEKLKQLTHVEIQAIQPKPLIHPNPASEYIEIFCGSIGACSNENNIWASPNASLIMIYNTLGQCVVTTSAFPSTGSGSDMMRIDISHLPNGVYYLRIGNQTQMFVKM